MTQENKINDDTVEKKKLTEKNRELGLKVAKILGLHVEKTSTGEEFLANEKGEEVSKNINYIMNIDYSALFAEIIDKAIEDNVSPLVFVQTIIGKENWENEIKHSKHGELFELLTYAKKIGIMDKVKDSLEDMAEKKELNMKQKAATKINKVAAKIMKATDKFTKD